MKIRMNNISKLAVLFLATAFIMLLSCHSVLFNANLEDSSIFFTIGKEMKHGAVVYKDVIDAKGIYIFLINMIAAIISENSTFGIWVMQLVAIYIANIFVIKTVLECREASNFQRASIVALVFDFLYCYTYIAYFGNKTEIYAAPALVYTMYILMKCSKMQDSNNLKNYALQLGITLGYLINFKLTFILMPSALVFMLFIKMIMDKHFKSLGEALLKGLAGFLIGNIPMILYCTINNCFSEMIEYSILLNLRYVSSDNNILVNSIISWFTNKYGVDCCVLLILIIISMSIIANEKQKWYKITVYLVMTASLFEVVCAGRLYYHYYIYIIPLLLPLIISLGIKIHIRLSDNHTFNVTLLCVVLLLLGNILSTTQVVIQQKSSIGQTLSYYNEHYTEDTKTLYVGTYGEFHLGAGIDVDKHFSIQVIPYKNYTEALDYKYDLILNNDYDVIVYQREYLKEGLGCYLRDDIQEYINNNYNVAFIDSTGNIIYEKIK